MQQIARNATLEGCGALRHCRYLLHDRDTKYSAVFRAIRNKSGQNSISTASKSKLKCLRRAMGTIGQGRVLVEDHPFWRPLPADHVGLSLMIPLSVVVCNIFAHCPLGGRRPRGGRGTCPRRKDRAGVEATQDCWLTRGYGSAGRSEYHVLSDKRPRCGLDKTAERPL